MAKAMAKTMAMGGLSTNSLINFPNHKPFRAPDRGKTAGAFDNPNHKTN